MDDWYDIRPGDGHLRDAYLQTEEIRTYLIRPIVHTKDEVDNGSDTPDANRFRNGIRFNRQTSTSNVKGNISRIQK
ncbi:hypothetical protein TNIN_70811, partial [Trichonephila inaurata madagascariensis]